MGKAFDLLGAWRPLQDPTFAALACASLYSVGVRFAAGIGGTKGLTGGVGGIKATPADGASRGEGRGRRACCL